MIGPRVVVTLDRRELENRLTDVRRMVARALRDGLPREDVNLEGLAMWAAEHAVTLEVRDE